MRPLQCVDRRCAVAFGDRSEHPDRRLRQAPSLPQVRKSECACNPHTFEAIAENFVMCSNTDDRHKKNAMQGRGLTRCQMMMSSKRKPGRGRPGLNGQKAGCRGCRERLRSEFTLMAASLPAPPHLSAKDRRVLSAAQRCDQRQQIAPPRLAPVLAPVRWTMMPIL